LFSLAGEKHTVVAYRKGWNVVVIFSVLEVSSSDGVVLRHGHRSEQEKTTNKKIVPPSK
jgi:hypothetical protein